MSEVIDPIGFSKVRDLVFEYGAIDPAKGAVLVAETSINADAVRTPSFESITMPNPQRPFSLKFTLVV